MAEASSIEGKDERERRLLQIDIAISETIRYRGILENLEKRDQDDKKSIEMNDRKGGGNASGPHFLSHTLNPF